MWSQLGKMLLFILRLIDWNSWEIGAYLVVCCSQSVNNGSWVGLVCVFHFLGRSRTHLGAL